MRPGADRRDHGAAGRYTLVGFHVKGCPVTDELLAPFAGTKAWSISAWRTAPSPTPVSLFSPLCPKLRYLLLDGNAAIHGSGLPALQGCKLDLLTLNRTGLDDAGLLQAASIPKLSHIQIDHTALPMRACWPSLATTASSRWPMCNSPRSRWNTSPSSSGKRPKSPSSWISRRWRMPQGAVRFLC